MIKKKPKRKRIEKYIFSFDILQIQKQDLSFAVIYAGTGSRETYTDILHYSELEKPHGKYKIRKIYIIYQDKIQKELTKLESEKLLLFLDFHNKKQPYEKK